MREAARLELAGVAQHRARGADRGTVPRLDAESVERREAVGAGQIVAGEIGIEFPRLALGDGHGVRAGERMAAPGGDDHLRRLEA